MKPLRITAITLVVIFLLILIISWLLWFVKPAKPFEVIIMDKTVNDFARTGHRSLVWVLNHNKFFHANHRKYSLSRDYYGFVPLTPKNSGNYDIRRFLLSDNVERMEESDVLYFADMYGIYFNEWYKSSMPKGPSTKIIGGINNSDYSLLKFMLGEKKTIIIESVFFCEPTDPFIRFKTEELLDIHPTGWSGRYFRSLDSTGKEIPKWVINTYRHANDGKWPFKNAGIVFIKNNNQAVVLEEGRHLEFPMPQLVTAKEKAAFYNIPEQVSFPNWFEVFTASKAYKDISVFTIKANSAGESILNLNGIPTTFPGSLVDATGKLFFLAGDFSNNKMTYCTFRLAGYFGLKSKIHSEKNTYLWNYYIPFMTKLFNDISLAKEEGKVKKQ